MATERFFDESREQSQVKAEIVRKYFSAWAKVIMPHATKGSIAYIDLFAGPGRYKDGTASTPLRILQTAIDNPQMREMLVTMFNDGDANNSRSLETAIAALPGIDTLRHRPVVHNHEVGETIVKQFEEMRLVPSLIFVDPWGYKGLSLRLVNAVLKDWACECIFFFNYNRINAGLSNPMVEEHMAALFGDRAPALRQRLEGMAPQARELTIVEELTAALQEMGGRYVLPFVFKNEAGTRTSHHLFFVSKHPLGYGIMKQIMAKESSSADQGVPSFVYNPAGRNCPLLFELTRPLDDLAGMLLADFAGQTASVKQIFERHNIGRPYLLENYKAILKELEAAGKVACTPPAASRRKRHGEPTMADAVRVAFPRRQ
jgi:three-Cys-motif partner protein